MFLSFSVTQLAISNSMPAAAPAKNEVDKALRAEAQADAAAKREIAERARINRLAKKDLRARNSYRQAKLREKFGAEASAFSVLLDDYARKVIKDFIGKRQASHQFVPEILAKLERHANERWEVMGAATNTTLVDYGVVRWKNRVLPAGFLRVKLKLRNAERGEYKNICFVFGFLKDEEFGRYREPYEGECGAAGKLAKYKLARSFASRWVVSD